MKFPKGREQKGEKKLAYGRYNVKQTPRTANRVPNRNWKLHFFQSSRHRDEQRNVKQNTGNAGEKGGGGEQKWKVARWGGGWPREGERKVKGRVERIPGGVCYFANNPAENFHFDREKRRWGEGRVHVALRLRTGQCHTDQAWPPYGTVCSPPRERSSPPLSPTCYTHRIVSCFPRLFLNYDGETFFAAAREARQVLRALGPRELESFVIEFCFTVTGGALNVSMDFQNIRVI